MYCWNKYGSIGHLLQLYINHLMFFGLARELSPHCTRLTRGKLQGVLKGVMRTQECGKDPGGRRGKQQAMLTTCPFIPENHLSSFL